MSRAIRAGGANFTIEEKMPSKTNLKNNYIQIKNNIESIAVLSPNRFLYAGLDEGGILGTPTLYLSLNKDNIPEDTQYFGLIHNTIIKKYLTYLMFLWVSLGQPDYSKNLKVIFKESTKENNKEINNP